ncbi:MAG: hypothetical protein JWP69_2210 [Flaviaesturariibacter sp.]|nr:hypothetical protein [Flaviaesturariibacter sp.]
MKKGIPFLLTVALLSCYYTTPATNTSLSEGFVRKEYPPQSWAYFLQHLPVKEAPILDYRGRPIANQAKSAGILSYDVGKRDLQQCADALMRLRAEYLFAQGRHEEIAFRFVDGEWFRYKDYVKGRRPRISGGRVTAGEVEPVPVNHATLRAYLDIVYAFSSTLSLHRDLLPAADFAIGTVIITPGSPGHCSMIVDEISNSKGEKRYKLVESFMPAQSIYVLRNEADGSPWHTLQKGIIETASYRFTKYDLRRWE